MGLAVNQHAERVDRTHHHTLAAKVALVGVNVQARTLNHAAVVEHALGQRHSRHRTDRRTQLAAHAALAQSDANFVLIPEVPFDLEGKNGFLGFLKKRMISRGHAVIIVAEGAGPVSYTHLTLPTISSV